MPTLAARANNACEMCSSSNELAAFDIGPNSDANPATQVYLCATCREQVTTEPDPNHWKTLANSMWSEYPPVQVLAWRMLDRLSEHSWARDLKDMLYLEDDTLKWAKSGRGTPEIIHCDSNGVQLASGDTVILIKDLQVKGAGFVAKRGTAVKSISLVADNPDHIEGRVEGQRIVILTDFVKRR